MTSRGKLMVSMSIQRGYTSTEPVTTSNKNKVTQFTDHVQIQGASVTKENVIRDIYCEESDISFDSDDSTKDPDWKIGKKDRSELSDESDDSYEYARETAKGKRKYMATFQTHVQPDSIAKKKECVRDMNNNIQSTRSTEQVVGEVEIETTAGEEEIVPGAVGREQNVLAMEKDCVKDINNNAQSTRPLLEIAGEVEIETTAGEEEPLHEGARPKKAKKGMGNPESWQRNINKKLRMEGKSYKGAKVVGGKKSYCSDRSERIQGDRSCSKRCERSRKCGLVHDELRKEIFTAFWNKMDWNEKKAFVGSHVNKIQANSSSESSRRKFTYKYHLSDGGLKLPVCKDLFLSTLGISEHTVYEWLTNRDRHGFPEKSESDKSSTSKTRQGNSQGNESVKEFLEAVPRMPSHYCRSTSQKEYLEPTYSTFTHLYKVYKTFAENKRYKVAGIKLFTRVFNEMNLALFRPKKDQCDVCVGFETKNVSEDVYNKHIQRKNEARESKQRDKARALENENIIALTMDVQSVLLCPKIEASAIYFKTKLSCHNFTIYNLPNKEVFCYFWHEGEGGLTASSFASCIYDYLKCTVKDSTEEIIIYSDGCGYQNRNTTLSNTLLWFAVKNNITVKQCFLEKGHTQMEVDSVHSTIERRLRGRPIYSPSNYVELIEGARQNPYKVKYVDHSFFRDFTALKYYDSIRPGFKVGDPVVNDIRCLKYTPKGDILFKVLYSDEFLELPKKRNAKKPTPGDLENIPGLYDTPLKIKSSKYQHLQQLKEVIPRDYHTFYDTLSHE